MGEHMKGPRISARGLVLRDDKVLVSCYQDKDGLWFVVPGGGQRNRETLEACLIREMKEEANADVTVGRLRWVREFISSSHPDSNVDPSFHQVEVFFECTLARGTNVSLGETPDPGQTGLAWIAISELATIRFFPRMAARIIAGEIEDRLYLGNV